MDITAFPGVFSTTRSARRTKSGVRAKWTIVAAGVVLFVALLGHLSVRVSIRTLTYDVEEMLQSNLRLDQELRQLRLQLESAENPERLKSRARAELGMRSIKPQQVRQLVVRSAQG